MTPEQVHDELRAALEPLVTKEQLANFRAEIHRDLGDFKADLMKTIWLTQLSTIGIILVGIGLLLHFRL